MQDSIEGLLKSMSDNAMSPNTIRAYRADLTGFAEWNRSNLRIANLHNMPFLSMAALEKQAKNYLNYLRNNCWDQVAPRTLNRKASALRALGKHLGDPGFLSEYRCPKPAKAQPHPLPEGVNGVLEMLLAAPSDRHRALIALCGLSGLRVTEARLVTPSCINQPEMTISIFGKGSKYRTIPLGTTAWHFIKPAWVASVAADQTGDSPLIGRMSDSGARKFLTRVGVKCGFDKKLASHDLRATFATAAYAKTKDLRAVQELLGHASSQTTESYTGISMDAMRAAAGVV